MVKIKKTGLLVLVFFLLQLSLQHKKTKHFYHKITKFGTNGLNIKNNLNK